MSRRNTSSYNVTGTKRRATPSPTRSPARPSRTPSVTRPAAASRRPAPVPRLLLDPEHGEIDMVVDDEIQDRAQQRTRTYRDELATHSTLIGSLTTIDSCYVGLPDCDETGLIYRGRRLRFVSCMVRVRGDESIAVCTCDLSRKSRIESLSGSAMISHPNEYMRDECIHLSVVRSLPLCTEFLAGESPVIGDMSVQFSTDPCLFLVRDQRNGSGVVKVTRVTLTCLTCHKQGCEHSRYLPSEAPDSIREIREEIEEEEENRPPLLVSSPLPHCIHSHPLHTRRAVIRVADREGIVRTESIQLQQSDCCTYLVSPLPLIPLSASFAVERRLLIHYESAFTQAACSLNGYWRTMHEFMIRCGEDPTSILSLSSLKRGWTHYLSELEVAPDSFLCPECGQYPTTLIFDATTIGTRGDLASYAAMRDRNRILDSNLPGWFGTKAMRRQMREYSKGGAQISCWVPPEFGALLEDVVEPDGSFNTRFSPFFLYLFADSPIPDVLKVGTAGRARALLESLVAGTFDAAVKEDVEDLLRYLPVLFRALSLISFDAIPQSVRDILNSALILNDSVLSTPVRGDASYGLPVDSLLEYYPNWPLKRGRPVYNKDSRQDNMECSEKITNAHNVLSPGLLIVVCPHRFTYGFTILTSCESPRHVFELLITRMDRGEMPRTVIYDNSCHLSAYCLSREPGRFKSTRFLIDRFHERNHRTCCISMKLSEYAYDDELRRINSQAVEQTNATLRHVANIIPFLSVEKYRKSLMLFLSRNQRKSKITN